MVHCILAPVPHGLTPLRKDTQCPALFTGTKSDSFAYFNKSINIYEGKVLFYAHQLIKYNRANRICMWDFA